MTQPNDGGPAFPISRDVILAAAGKGMSLRDYFAGMALQSYLAGRNLDSRGTHCEETARTCYKYADAMISERTKAHDDTR